MGRLGGQLISAADEQIFYNIGSTTTPLNNWYASAPHDADGFATYSVPVNTPTNVARGFYYGYGNAGTRTYDVAANGGIDASATI